MANENERVLLTVDFDSKQAEKNAIALKTQIDGLKQANKELAESLKTGKITQDQYNKAFYDNEKAMKSANTELASINRNVALAEKANKKASGSLNEMKAAILLLTDSYDNLSKEERENEAVGGVLQKRIKALSDDLKAQKAQLGDNRLEVGNYKGGIIAAVKELGLFGGVTQKATEAQEALTKIQTVFKSSMGGSVGVLKLFKLALASTGIGLLIIGLAGLITFLTKTEKGVNFINKAMAGLSAVVGKVIDDLAGVGERIFDAFSNPKKALEDLVSFISGNVINRLKAFAVIFDALQSGDMRKANDGFIQLATGITNATDKVAAYSRELFEVAKAGALIEAENQRIIKSQLVLDVQRSNANKTIAALKFITEDVTRSEAERIKAVKQAFELEQSFLNRELKLQQDRIKNIRAEQALTKNTADNKQELAEAEIKRSELESQSLEKQNELRNKLNELLDLQKQKELARLEALKKAQEEFKQRTKAEYDEQAKFTEEFYTKQELALLKSLQSGELKQRAYEEKLSELKLASLQRQLQDAKDYGQLTTELEKKIAEETFKITQDSFKRQYDAIKVEVEKEKKLRNLIFNDHIEEITQQEAEANLAQLQARLAGNASEFELQQTQLQNELKFLELQRDAAKQHGDDLVAIDTEIAKKRGEIRDNDRRNAEQVEAAKFEFAEQSVAALSSLLELGASNAAQAAEFQKAIALFQIGIDTAQAISGVIRAAGTTSISPIDLAVKIAAGVATVLANVVQAKNLINSAGEVPKPEFYDGGLFDADGGYTEKGNPREEARNLGDKPYTYHKDEYIIPHTVLATSEGSALARAAERLRRMHPSNPSMAGMYNGGPADGGLTARSIMAGSNNNTELINGLITAMKGQKLFVTVTDINRGVNNVQVTADKATLGKK